MKKIGILLCCCFGIYQGIAQENFKTMFYNLLNYPDISPDRIDDLEFILNDYQPDLFMVCELNDAFGANQILLKLQGINPDYRQATFFTNTSDDNSGDFDDLQNLLY